MKRFKFIPALLLICASTLFHALPLLAQDEITTIILIRHAEKVDDSRDPDLSDQGLKRADALSSLLKNAEIDAIYSTDYKRTRTTVGPLALVTGHEVQTYDPRDADFIQKIYNNNIGKTVVVSGHSNTTPYAVNKLIGENKYENLEHDEFGTIFIVSLAENTSSEVLILHY